jgi:S1-C subfamily serine protease
VLATTAAMFCLTGCVPPGNDASSFGSQYNFTGLTSVKISNQVMEPHAALEALSRSKEAVLAQIPVENAPIAGSVRIVTPDHDRLRPVAAIIFKQIAGGPVEYFDENLRLEIHAFAQAVVRSHLFTSTTVIEQNDTRQPDPAGADYVLWYQVNPAGANNSGPWIGGWLLRKAGAQAADRVIVDTGTPPGAARYISFINSARSAATHPTGNAGLPGARRIVSNGSGIVVDAPGHILTNNHVIANCPDLRVVDTNGHSTTATVAAADAPNDLALLNTERHWPAWASFRDSHGLKPGEPVVVTGFPLAGVVSPEMAVTTGSLTALAGGNGDTRQVQFSAPVQPGNSGGPVLDESGRVVGVATSILTVVATGLSTAVVPQNVNFAIKANNAREFADSAHVTLDASPGHGTMNPAAIGALARNFTVKIECWR